MIAPRAIRLCGFQSSLTRDARQWRIIGVLVFDSTIFEHRLEREIPVKLQLHLVKTKGWVVRARENPTGIANKVDASTTFPFWSRLPVGVENLLVEGRLRSAQRYVVEFELRGVVPFPNPCKGVQDSTHGSCRDIGRLV